jgi:hypothetical protein
LHIPAAQDFLAPLHLHIYLFSIAYLFSVLYTYTHLVLENHLVRLRAQSNFILLCRLLEEGPEGSLYTQFSRIRYKTSSHLRRENQASLCSALYSWSLNLAKHQAIFWRRCRGTSRRIAHKKVFITNLCKRLSLGRLHLREYHLVLLDLRSTLFICYYLAYHFIFQF